MVSFSASQADERAAENPAKPVTPAVFDREFSEAETSLEALVAELRSLYGGGN
jgi:hypothetical protein